MNTGNNNFRVMFAPDTDTCWQLHSEFDTAKEAKDMARSLHSILIAHFLVEDNEGNVVEYLNANTKPSFVERQV